jgi:Flp pilus assembly protein TadD
LDRATALDPANPEPYVARGMICRARGDFDSAELNYRRALQLDSALPMAHFNLATHLLHRGATDDALRHLRLAHAGAPANAEVLKIYVMALVSGDLYEEAASVASAAAQANPRCYEAWLCAGMAVQKVNSPERALACYERAAELRSEDAELLHHKAIALQDLGRMEEALQCFNTVLQDRPDFVLARFHRALLYLLTGDYEKAWPDYELRLLSADVPPRARSHPRWDGGCLAGRSVLVYGEQGIGDEILFASCVPDLIADAEHCVIECAPKLKTLFERSFPQADVYAAGTSASQAANAVDCEVPIGSLPKHYRRSAGDFVKSGRYLRAAPDRVAKWKRKLHEAGATFNVGISWRGGMPRTRSPVRSVSLDQWAPILSIPHVSFISLQYGVEGAKAEIEALPGAVRSKLACWNEALADYEETAAVVCALDLIVSVSTSLVDLAGALGRPVWVLVPKIVDWRYGHAGDSMVWYPSATLFRQETLGEWSPAIDAIRTKLLGYGPSFHTS